AASLGAVVANYLEATALVTDAGRVAGARLVDRLSGERVTVSARTTINAAGVWAEQVARFVGPAPPFRIRRAKGGHIVLPNGRVGLGRTILVLPETDDGRIAFVLPSQGALRVGRTDPDWPEVGTGSAVPEV